MFLAKDLIDLIEPLPIIASILSTNLGVFFFYQSEASELSYLCNDIWTYPTLFEFTALSSDF